MADLIPPDLTTLDRVALWWFLLAWLGYGHAIHAMPPWMGSITARLHDVRRAWMGAMLGRDNRIVDASLLGHTVHSATFFASTTMVALTSIVLMLLWRQFGSATAAAIGRSHATLVGAPPAWHSAAAAAVPDAVARTAA